MYLKSNRFLWSRKVASVVLASTLALAGTAVLAPAASAAVIDNAITGIETQGTATPGEHFQVNLTWQVPAGAQPGDTFVVDLPPNMTSVNNTFELRNAAGDLVAVATTVDGNVVFTLTDFVADHDDVQGTAFFWVELSEDAQPGTQETISSEGNVNSTVTVVAPGVTPGENTRHEAQKYGRWNAQNNQMDWFINGPLGYDSVFFSDDATGNQKFDCANLRLEIWTLTELGGWASSVRVSSDDVQCTETHFQATIKNIPAGKIATVVLPTFVPAGSTVVENTATVTYGTTTDNPGAEAPVQGAGGDGDGNLRLGSVSWTKTDGTAALAGSEWSLTDAAGTALPVVDNGVNDADPAAGALAVTGLAWGSYDLVEAVAPAGYVLDTTVRAVTIDGAHLTVALGEIVNVPVPPVTPPLPPVTPPVPPVTPPVPPVTPPVPPVTPPLPPVTPSTPPVETELALTGADGSLLAGGAGLLVVLGAGLLFFMRRRGSADS